MLVIRRGGLGDTMLMAPVLAAMRRHWEQRLGSSVELCFAGVREFADVLAAHGACDRAMSSESLGLYALALRDELGMRTRARLAHYVAIAGDDPALRAVEGPEISVFDPAPQRWDEPLPLQIGAQLRLDVRIEDEHLTRSDVQSGGAIALAPGSGAREKCWPQGRWLELASRLARQQETLRIVVGPTEQERDDPRKWDWPCAVHFLAELSCLELARALQTCAAFVGNDSGTSHLAAMLDVPTVAIFGAGWPRVFGPLGRRVATVVGSGAAPPDVEVHEVLRALAALRGC